jgi:hypothetical protein
MTRFRRNSFNAGRLSGGGGPRGGGGPGGPRFESEGPDDLPSDRRGTFAASSYGGGGSDGVDMSTGNRREVRLYWFMQYRFA